MTTYVAWCSCGWSYQADDLAGYTRHRCPNPLTTVTTLATYQALLDQTLPRERQDT